MKFLIKRKREREKEKGKEVKRGKNDKFLFFFYNIIPDELFPIIYKIYYINNNSNSTRD